MTFFFLKDNDKWMVWNLVLFEKKLVIIDYDEIHFYIHAYSKQF